MRFVDRYRDDADDVVSCPACAGDRPHSLSCIVCDGLGVLRVNDTPPPPAMGLGDPEHFALCNPWSHTR